MAEKIEQLRESAKQKSAEGLSALEKQADRIAQERKAQAEQYFEETIDLLQELENQSHFFTEGENHETA